MNNEYPKISPISTPIQLIMDRQSCLYGHMVRVNKYPSIRPMDTLEDMVDIIGIEDPIFEMDIGVYGGLTEKDLERDDISRI